MSGLRVAAFVSGASDPSARFRVLQHTGRLGGLGVAVTPFLPRFSSFPPRARALRPLWGAAVLGERLGMTAAARAFQLTMFQKTMVSTLCTLEPACPSPRVLDVDDPIHFHRGGRAAQRVAQACDLVICGNAYLADWYARWARDVAVLPTAVDTERWRPAETRRDGPPCVGWIGSSCNFRYLEQRQRALRRFLDANPGWTLRVVADRAPRLPDLPPEGLVFSPWSEETEVAEVRRFSIGIMPLADGEPERGKCAFKMLQYMACAVPVVVSPEGMNAEVLAQGACGFGPRDDDAWAEALTALARDESLRRRLGAEGRAVIERSYAASAVAPRLAELLRRAAGVPASAA